MWGQNGYPITVAEMGAYAEEADQLFGAEEHERLKEYLAFLPNSGDMIAGAGGVRKFVWLFKSRGKNRQAHVIYYFRDLNMPLYLLAVYAEEIEFDDEWRNDMARLVAILVEEHGKKWTRIPSSPESSA